MSKMHLSASEKNSLIRLNVAYEILASDSKSLDKRIGRVKYGRRDIAMIRSKIHSIMRQINDTIPDDQMPTYVRALEMAEFVVGAKRPGGSRDDRTWGMWISYSELNALLDGCHDHCMMCSMDLAQRRACGLRKAMDVIPNDAPVKDDGDCPYYTLL